MNAREFKKKLVKMKIEYYVIKKKKFKKGLNAFLVSYLGCF